MAISSTTRKAGPFTGNDSATVFPFAYKVFDTGDVHAVLTDADSVDAALVLGTDYSVALNADQDSAPGGSVTLTAPLATGNLLTLTSNLDELQPTVLTNSGGFYPDVLNDSLDRLTILAQQIKEKVDRAVAAPITEYTGSTIPKVADRANMVAYFNGAGQLAGLVDADSYRTAFDAVIEGTQPLLDLIGDTGDATFAETVATLNARLDEISFGVSAFIFDTPTGGPYFRIGAIGSHTDPTLVTGFGFSRNSIGYRRRQADSGLTTAAVNKAVIVPAEGLYLNAEQTNYIERYTDTRLGLLGLFQSSDQACIISLVDDTAALTAANLLGLNGSGIVLKIDNSAGAGSSFVQMKTAPIANGSTVFYQAYCRCDTVPTEKHAYLGVENSTTATVDGVVYVGETNTVNTTYTRVDATTITVSSNSRLYFKVAAGGISYFVLPYIYIGSTRPRVPLPIFNPGTFTGVIASNMVTTVLDPTVTTGMTLSGANSANAALAVVDDTATTTLQSVLNTFGSNKSTIKVYNLDNSITGAGDAIVTLPTAATTNGVTYQLYTFMRRRSAAGTLAGQLQYGGVDKFSHGRPYWNYIGGTVVGVGAADKVSIKVPFGCSIDFLQVYLQTGSLPVEITPWNTAAAVNDGDELTLSGVSSQDLVIEWGGGVQQIIKSTEGSPNLGYSGQTPWLNKPISYIRSTALTDADLRSYTPLAAVNTYSTFVYVRDFAGGTFDPTTAGYTHLDFADEFDAPRIVPAATGTPGPNALWFTPGHTPFPAALTFSDITANDGTFTYVGDTLRIRLKDQTGGGIVGGYTAGCMSSINTANEGYLLPARCYAEARVKIPDGDVAGWFAFWGTSELTYAPGTPSSARRSHVEIDFEVYTDESPKRVHLTSFIHNRGTAIPGGTTGDVRSQSETPLCVVADGNWHTLGYEFTDQWIIKYVDRVEVSRIPMYNEVRLGGIHMLLDYTLNTDVAGPWTSQSDVFIDYVKVWAKP